jgi:hypothetical protein
MEGLLSTSPALGGLLATNYPNPYGLRAYQMQNGLLGGEMMPKYIGWMGVQKGKGELKGQDITEFSVGDERGDFPSIYPNMPKHLLEMVLRGQVTPEIFQNAQAFANYRRNSGLSPFRDVGE